MSEKYIYNSWPLGKVPKELQRPELDELKNRGYEFSDPRDVVDIFEEKVAKFAGSKYAISIDCCSHGIFLCLKYLESIGETIENVKNAKYKFGEIIIPSRTYVSAPMQINQSGYAVKFEDVEWSGLYRLQPTRVWDAAVRWTKDMYVGNDALQIVSFQIKKRIPIGKGGIILTDDKDAYDWLKLARYDGRDMTVPYTDENHILMMGYHMYMTPEDAARGIILMDEVNKHSDEHEDTGGHLNYTDLSSLKIFNK
jgi:dTDP-4-amino-4,6-dideoxygalactose transaminase